MKAERAVGLRRLELLAAEVERPAGDRPLASGLPSGRLALVSLELRCVRPSGLPPLLAKVLDDCFGCSDAFEDAFFGLPLSLSCFLWLSFFSFFSWSPPPSFPSFLRLLQQQQ